MQQPALGLVIAVADQQAGRVVTRVERHAVGGVEFLETVPLGPEMHQVLPGLVELEDVVARVAVRQEDVAVGGDGDRRGIEFLQLQARFLGKRELQDDLAGPGVELDSLGVVVAGRVDELAVRFLADLHVVDVGILVAEEAADHLAVGREDEDAGVGARVDVAVLVDDDAAVASARSRTSRRRRGPSPAPCRTSSARTPSARAGAYPPRRTENAAVQTSATARPNERFFMVKAPGCFNLRSPSDRTGRRSTATHDRVRYAARPSLSGCSVNDSTSDPNASSPSGVIRAEWQWPQVGCHDLYYVPNSGPEAPSSRKSGRRNGDSGPAALSRMVSVAELTRVSLFRRISDVKSRSFSFRTCATVAILLLSN